AAGEAATAEALGDTAADAAPTPSAEVAEAAGEITARRSRRLEPARAREASPPNEEAVAAAGADTTVDAVTAEAAVVDASPVEAAVESPVAGTEPEPVPPSDTRDAPSPPPPAPQPTPVAERDAPSDDPPSPPDDEPDRPSFVTF
ncbi:MAG: hypothetical protein AAGH15_01240, partial [Myxococcota bacterium]